MSKESTLQYRLKFIAKLTGTNKTVLDIGYLQTPNKWFDNCSVDGLDKIDIRTTTTIPYGYKTIYKCDCQSKIGLKTPKIYDVVVAGEVIEHLTNPGQFLENIKTIMKENGKVIISTPNPYYIFQMIIEMFPFLPDGEPEDHLIFFSQRQIKKLFKEVGFKIIKKYPVSFNIPLLGIEFPVKRVPMIFSNRIIYEAVYDKKHRLSDDDVKARFH